MEIQNFDLEALFNYHLELEGDDYKDPEKVLAACQVKGHVRAWAKNGNIFQVKWIDTPTSNILYDSGQLIMAVANRLAKIQPDPEPEQVPVFEDDQNEPEVERDNFVANATDAAVVLADENHVNLKNVKGTGKDGRIGVQDVRNYLSFMEAFNEPEEDLSNG